MSKRVYLSPSDQTNNAYAYGNTTEAIQCGKIAAACKAALERCGVSVMVGQYDSMANRCAASDTFGADLHVPIHTNASNGSVTGTRMFSFDAIGEGYQACKAIFAVLAPLTPGTSESIKADPSLYEIKHPAAPTAYIECDFHDNAAEAKWIVEHTTEIGEAIAAGICNYFGIAEQEKAVQSATASKPVAAAVKNESEETIEMELRMLSKGMRGNDVHAAMVLMQDKGYYSGKCDDLFGPKMEAGLRQMQKDHGLGVDGILGANSWGYLLK